MTRPSRRDGFTLTELVVALAVLAIVTSQFLLAFTNQQRSYHEHEGVVDAQQEARVVMELMLDDLRMAGFMVPKQVGVTSVDGGPNGSDILCVSDSSAMARTRVEASNSRFEGATPSAAVGAGATSVQLPAASLDIDGNGAPDFVQGGGILISDGTRAHCGVVTNVGVGDPVTVSFDRPTPAGFALAAGSARAVPAVVYAVAANQLTRNGRLLSTGVEDLQIEFGVDEDGNGQIGAAEFPINDLAGSTLSRIRTARVSVTARTARPDATFQGGYTAIANRVAGPVDNFRRRRLIGDATLRNMR